MKNITKHNRPIHIVLKEYVERHKGKVVAARKELQRRFNGLDWNIQKKILLAHLISSKSDREWAYPLLLNYWDESFKPYIRELWETFHEERCSWIIVRYFSKDYIFNNLHLLNYERNYMFVCLRFGLDKDFSIDKDKLKPKDALYVHYKLGMRIEPDEASALLYEIVIDAILNYYRSDLDLRPSEHGRVTELYPERIRQFGLALYYIKEMCIEPTMSEFSEWCKSVKKIMNSSLEWKELQQRSLLDWEFNLRAYRIVLKYVGIHLPVSVMDNLINKYPQLKILVDKLKLEIDFDYMLIELEENYWAEKSNGVNYYNELWSQD